MERPLYHYEYVNEPFDDIIELLADDASAVLQDATHVAAQRAREVVTTLRVPVGEFEIGRDIRIEVGDFVPKEIRCGHVQLRWHAERHAALFPAVQAKLEIAALSLEPPLSQVTLVGSYVPPFGAVGAAADEMVGHRIAEATIHRFVVDVVDRIRDQLAARRSRRPSLSMLDY